MTAQMTRPALEEIRSAVDQLRQRQRRRKRRLIALIIVIILIIAALLTVAAPVRVKGTAMLPTLRDGQIVLVNKLNRSSSAGQVLALNHQGETILRRVAATAGQTVAMPDAATGVLYVNGEPLSTESRVSGVGTSDMPAELTVSAGELFVLGDNLVEAEDSRLSDFGQVTEADILGTAWAVLYPPELIR